MTRLRLAVPATYQFSIRYLVHTGLLARLAQVVEPVVMLSWEDPALVAALESRGIETQQLTPPQREPVYDRHRQRIDLLHERRLRSPSSGIDWHRRDARLPVMAVARRRARRAVTSSAFIVPGVARRALAEEERLVQRATNLSAVGRQFEQLGLDAVLSITPFHHQEDLFLRAAALRELRCVTSIISFDNPTTRGWMPIHFDRYLVWNHHMVEQLTRSIPEVTADQVSVTGAPQFDFYEGDAWRWDEDRWRAVLGIPMDRPVVLFGGGPADLVPEEATYLSDLDDAITDGAVPGDPIIVFRRHPNDRLDRFRACIERASNVIVDDPWAARTGDLTTSSASVPDIERLVSTLSHAAVHVNTSSTLTVDGAYFDRPQVGPAYPVGPQRSAGRQVQDLYRREHWQPIADSGGMVLAQTRDQLIEGVVEELEAPARRRAERRRLVEEIVTYRDGRATERVVAEVAATLGLAAPAPGPAGAPHPGKASTGVL